MKKLSLSVILASVLLSSSLSATSTEVKSVQAVNQNTVKKEAQNTKVLQKKLVKEAITSLQFTKQALDALSSKDTQKAQENIEKALGKLEVILAAKNAPKLLPIDSQVAMSEFVGTKEDIVKTIDVVKDLIDENQIQSARVLLNTLKSEIDVKVVSLPLVTYPDALKLAAKYIHENEIEKAKNVLGIALSTFDENITVIPLPLLKATELVNLSAELSKNGKKEEALKYLTAAEDELYIAEKLGYVTESDWSYKTLHSSIKDIEKEIKGKNDAEKLFDKLKEELKDFKDKILPASKVKEK